MSSGFETNNTYQHQFLFGGNHVGGNLKVSNDDGSVSPSYSGGPESPSWNRNTNNQEQEPLVYYKKKKRSFTNFLTICISIGVIGGYFLMVGTVRSTSKTGEDGVDLLGGSHKKKHHKHQKSLDASPHSLAVDHTQAVAGLQLTTGYPSPADQIRYREALDKIDWEDVEEDIIELLTTSQDDYWPADYGNYGPLFIRLAWHSCGSYRMSDGRGGCDGGAQRFDPERSWVDNTNLDKARQLLQPIKLKYGVGLSWGDLFAFAGTIAIKSMGGPYPGFCPGRMDVIDNSQTLPLGPSKEQDQFGHCEVNGQCPYPLGSNTLGLIYVNPEGPMGEPDLQGAADTIRDVFGRMDWHSRELVALIGGGHTFGKAHGASTADNGLPPNKCPFHPWDGPKGMDSITSGFEGPWTENPIQWDNKYFQYLVDFDWEPLKGPGGHYQWQVVTNSPQAPVSDPHKPNEKQNIMMLTTDVALKIDPEYNQYVKEFANNETAFKEAFSDAWYKLVTRDMGPVTRCAGTPPPAFEFQNPLPYPAHLRHHHTINFDHVEADIGKLVSKHPDGEFLRLAYQCASTYRATDYQGGCNGARIRFSPGLDWPINAGLNHTIQLLEPIKEKYGAGLSFADVIVLAGNVAAEKLNEHVPKIPFCKGRVDALDGLGWEHISYGISEAPTSVNQLIELYVRRGQTSKEFVALTFMKYDSSETLKDVLESKDTEKDDVLVEGLKYYPELRNWAEYYASAGTGVFASDFATAWTKLMNADRFDGPVGNLCG